MISLFQYVNERSAPLNLPKGEMPSYYQIALPLWGSRRGLVENIGVEPMTSCVQGRRSSQLS